MEKWAFRFFSVLLVFCWHEKHPQKQSQPRLRSSNLWLWCFKFQNKIVEWLTNHIYEAVQGVLFLRIISRSKKCLTRQFPSREFIKTLAGRQCEASSWGWTRRRTPPWWRSRCRWTWPGRMLTWGWTWAAPPPATGAWPPPSHEPQQTCHPAPDRQGRHRRGRHRVT